MRAPSSSRWLRWLVWSGLAVLVLAVALAWFVASDLALRLAVARAVEALEGRLSIEQPERLGLAGMRAKRVIYADEKLRVQADDVTVVLSARSLLHAKPVVRKLVMAELRIRPGPPSAEPARLPDSLALPLEASVESAEIARLVIEDEGSGTELTALRFAFAYGGGRYRLSHASVETPWARVAGALELAHAPPFALSGAFELSPRMQAIGPFAVALAGRLERIGVGAYGSAYGGTVRAQASLTPFSTEQIAAIHAGMAALDPRRIHASAPQARLHIETDATLAADGSIAGQLRVDNVQPGSPAQSRLPLTRLTSSFRGSGTRWTLDEIALDAGRAGRLAGKGSLDGQRIELALHAHDLDLKAVHPDLHATAFSGPLRLASDGTRVDFDATLAQTGLRAVLAGEYVEDRLTLHTARFSGHGGELALAGALATSAPYRFTASGSVRALDPSRLGEFPQAVINGKWSGEGALAPLAASAAWNIADSRFRGQPMTSAGRLRLAPQRASDVDVTLAIGSARAQAQGAFGAAGDRLVWSVNAPDLRILQEAAAGQLRANGSLSGNWQAPAVELQADGKALRWGEGVRLGQLKASGMLAEGMVGRFELRASADKLVFGEKGKETTLDSVRIELDGTRASHEARFDVASGKYRLDGRVAGGLGDGMAWSGTVGALQLQGPLAARIDQPVSVSASAESGSVGPASMQLGDGRIELASLSWQGDGRLSTRGSLRGIALAGLTPLVALPEPIRGLVIAGEWNVEAGASLDGTASLWRESGDVVIAGTPSVAAGLRTLRIDLHARDAAIALEANLDTSAFGSARASGSTRAERRGNTWGIAGNAPLALHATARMPSLAWARPLIGDAVRLEGQAELDVKASGSLAQPALAGDFSAAGLRVSVPDYGLALSDGQLKARFDQQRMEIVALRFAGGDGALEGRGHAEFAAGKISARVDFTAQKLTVVSRPDRLVVLSGKAGLDWSKNELRAKGELTADRGVIELPREDKPVPSSDVVVLKRQAAAQTEVGIHADLRLDLGKNFVLRGRGLDAHLIGTLRAELTPKTRPAVTGTVRTSSGSFTAFGQTLTIDRAALTFAGPPDNPALDIVAVRKTREVEVGVAVGGTALLPQVRLVSTPPMSDADKLAWLTLGHGLDKTGGNEAAVLQAATLALLSSGSSGSGGSFTSRFGLDELSVSTQADTGERIVTLGKRFATNVYVGFERGVTGAVSVVKITYDLSQRWSVQARAGTENAVDFFYTLGFR